MTAGILPPGFESLEPFVAQWTKPTTAERSHQRDASSAAERRAFYDAAKDMLPAALALLDRKALADFDAADTTLMNLMLALGHVVLAIEVQGPEEDNHRQVREHMRVTRSPADQNP